MIAVVALHDPFQPLSHDAHRLMHLPAQLLLDGLELHPHPLGRRSPPYYKVTL
jgi:hypothetical protein